MRGKKQRAGCDIAKASSVCDCAKWKKIEVDLVVHSLCFYFCFLWCLEFQAEKSRPQLRNMSLQRYVLHISSGDQKAICISVGAANSNSERER